MVSELHGKYWAVVTDKEVVASGITYNYAKEIRNRYAERTKNGGTCVVTNAVAARMKGIRQMATKRDQFRKEVFEAIKDAPYYLPDNLLQDDIDKIADTVLAVFDKLIPSCLSKADADEPVFVLRGQDETAPATVVDWIARNVSAPPPKLAAARNVIHDMENWPIRKKAD